MKSSVALCFKDSSRYFEHVILFNSPNSLFSVMHLSVISPRGVVGELQRGVRQFSGLIPSLRSQNLGPNFQEFIHPCVFRKKYQQRHP